MAHDDVLDNLKAFLDGELEAGQEADVKEHLATCADCRGELERLSDLSWRVGQLPEPEPPDQLRARIMERIARPSRWTLALRWSFAGAGALAVAAVCFVWLSSHRPTGSTQIAHGHFTGASPVVPGRAPGSAAPRGAIVFHETVVEVRVADLGKAWKDTAVLARGLGGRVLAYERTTADVGAGRQRVFLTVPLGSLKTAVAGLAKLGRVSTRNSTKRDISSEVADTYRRIGEWRQYEDRMTRAMAFAPTVPKVLEMDRAVARAREEIARLQAHANELIGYGQTGCVTIILVGPSRTNPPMSCIGPATNTVA
jgi:hypothetical protein